MFYAKQEPPASLQLVICLGMQEGFNEHVNIAIHNSLGIASFSIGTMILNHVLWMAHVRANLAAPFDFLLVTL